MQFIITGSDSHSGQPVEVRLEAADAAAAAAQAARMGIQVTGLSSAQAIGVPCAIVESAPVRAAEAPPAAAASGATEAIGYAGPDPRSPRWLIKRRWFWIFGMLGIEALVIFGFYVWAAIMQLNSSDPLGGLLRATLIFAVPTLILFATQLALLSPVTRPRESIGAVQPAWQWLSAIALGLMLGVMVVVALAMLADFLWYLGAPEGARDGIAGAGLVVAIVSWIVSTPLVVMFMRRRRPEGVLAMGASAMFLGSTLEFVAAIPLLALIDRKNNCYCATFTFWSMFLTAFTGFLSLGPIILLVLFGRRSRAISKGHCAACGFDMRGLSNRDQCPKCGSGWRPLAKA